MWQWKKGMTEEAADAGRLEVALRLVHAPPEVRRASSRCEGVGCLSESLTSRPHRDCLGRSILGRSKIRPGDRVSDAAQST